MPKFLIFVFALSFSSNQFARESMRLDSGWRFKSGDITNAETSDFGDSGWQTVSTPHNWGWERAQQGKDYYRGPGWYRRELDLKPEAGKRYFLRFAEVESQLTEIVREPTMLKADTMRCVICKSPFIFTPTGAPSRHGLHP